jgi:homoserine kinase
VLRVRAPASTANLGAGFDCAGAALDLWNEVVVHEGGGPADTGHLGVRAFSLLAEPDGFSFEWTDRIPRERGLGSSASVIALGLVAAAATLGKEPDLQELLVLGAELEGHADNLAAALAGGVCLTVEGRIERIADEAPATPVAIVPDEAVNTSESRGRLPAEIPLGDAAFSAARAALLGAGLVAGSEELFAAALDDRLHEPYRSPFLREVRRTLPDGALGATLSGSGPTVIVWARREQAAACEDRLRTQFPQTTVIRLDVTPRGAHLHG